MPWIIGVDEAGYGPNFGPLVMTSVSCHVPTEFAQRNHWQLLKKVVRRYGEQNDGRILIEDSKKVYKPAKGLKNLERGVLSALTRPSEMATHFNIAESNGETNGHLTFNHWIQALSPAAHSSLLEECWYHGTSILPSAADPNELFHACERFHLACEKLSFRCGTPQCLVVCPTQFNALLDKHRTKAAVLVHCLIELLRLNIDPDDGNDPILFVIDKHGGRNNYRDLLRAAVPGGKIVPLEETDERSMYEIVGHTRDVWTTFAAQSDANHLVVALASMLAKYVRELCMNEFNQFWRTHLPELKPTAGYPVDANRFMNDIRSKMEELGIAINTLWRRL